MSQILGRELRAVNIDMDAAPVMDVDTNPDNPVIGEYESYVCRMLGERVPKTSISTSFRSCYACDSHPQGR